MQEGKTMLELMKKYYEQVQVLKNAYDAAEEQKNEAGKAAAREQYHQWKKGGFHFCVCLLGADINSDLTPQAAR